MTVKNDYPAIMPELVLDFVNSSALDPRITFTRSSTATRVNSRGLIETTPKNQPRIDYDPTTKQCKGLLIEEQRTNAALNSNTFNLSLGTTETLNATISPDGTQNASLITETTANGEHYSLDRGIAVTSGTTYVWSFYAKQGAGSVRKAYCRVATAATASVMFDLVTGSGFVASPTNLVTYGSQQLSNGWWRCFVVFTAASTATAICRAQLATGSNAAIYTGDGVSGIYLWGAQLEVGAFPTSYIPTTSASVTRAADNASMVGTNFSSWYNQSEGTFAVNAIYNRYNTSVFLASISNADSNVASERVQIAINTSNNLSDAIVTGGVAIVSAMNSVVTNSTYKTALALKSGDYSATANGNIPNASSATGIPTVDRFKFGANPAGNGGYLNGHIQSIRYYPIRLTNTQLQTLTKS